MITGFVSTGMDKEGYDKYREYVYWRSLFYFSLFSIIEQHGNIHKSAKIGKRMRYPVLVAVQIYGK